MNVFRTIKSMASRMSLMLALAATATAATAQDKEIIPIGLGQHTTKEGMFQDNYYSFTAPMSGTLTVSSSSDIPTVYTDSNFETHAGFSWLGYGIGLGKAEAGYVEKDRTYYLHVCPFDPMTFELSMEAADAKPTIELLTPEEGSVFNATGDGLIGIRFSKNISYSAARLVSNGAEVELSGNMQNGIYAFDIKKILFSWLTEKVLEPGDEFLFVMDGVCDAHDPSVIYGEDGMVVVRYIAPEIPVVKMSESVPTEFLSYWMPGDPDGIITLTFSDEIADGTTAILGWGNNESEGEYYRESIPTKVNGNTLTVDLTGKLRTPKTMLPESTLTDDYTSMHIQINNIKDTKGNFCYAEGQGSLGSFGWQPAYKDITGNIFTEFLPASGSSLEGVSSIELWIDRRDLIAEYTGIAVGYTPAEGDSVSTLITKDKLTIVEGDDLTITIPVDEGMQKGKNVSVSLAGVLFTDGFEREIKAVYNLVDTGIDTPANATDALNGTFDIFTTDGKLIVRGASHKTLNALKPGIYVAGGMKIVIK